MVHNEATLQKIVFDEYAARAIVVPNAYFHSSRWEMDVLVVMKSGLSYEFEIKCTREDFKNELKNKRAKHKYMGLMENRWGRYHNNANYYSILCPDGLLTTEDVDLLSPGYGLYRATKLHMVPVRKPKKLHDNRISSNDYRHLCIKLMYKVFNHCDKYQIRIAQ